jgi:hypothetical protein
VAHHHEEAGHKAACRPLVPARRPARRRSFAGDDALRLFARARGLVPKGEQELWADVLLAQEAVLDRMGRREDQRATLDELGTADGLDPGRRALARLAEGRWLFFRGEYPAVPPVAEEAADLRPAGEPGRSGVRRADAGRPQPGLPERARRRPRAAQPVAHHRPGAG